MKYTDPGGNEVATVSLLGLAVIGTALILAVDEYLKTPAGQEGVDALSNAIATGIQNTEGIISNIISSSKTKVQEKSKPQLLYRAVNQNELDSIVASNGKFSMGDSSTYESGKLFQTDLADAYGYAELANSTIAKDDPYVAIVETSDPTRSGIAIDSIVDAPSAVIVPSDKLHLLTPAIVLPLEN